MSQEPDLKDLLEQLEAVRLEVEKITGVQRTMRPEMTKGVDLPENSPADDGADGFTTKDIKWRMKVDLPLVVVHTFLGGYATTEGADGFLHEIGGGPHSSPL